MTPSFEAPEYTNRLINETSPYLLQHAHNPVDWYPWCPEALERARNEDRLILLSIGYSACHWCHVMERESFENERIAALMNELYVNIKVDREERPDLDEIYMAATLAMNQGQGGWPMTVFLSPELKPVFAGTYFPPERRFGRPGFPDILVEIDKAWRNDRDNLRRLATRVVEYVKRERASVGSPAVVGTAELELALDQYYDAFDASFGGFGSAPKFPPATALSLLLRLHERFEDSRALDMVRKTLDDMAKGGMYDHIGGGFARYSTDRRWLVPHFEKMLYDNALLAMAYLEAYQVTGDTFYRDITTEILDYALRDMRSPEGVFYSSTDADSEGEEGKFFVWTPVEIAEVLDESSARAFCSYYDITPHGNWEGRSIPNTPHTLELVASQLGLTADALRDTLLESRNKVFKHRLGRVAPALDDKVLTSWNGMMVNSLAAAYRVLGEERYLLGARGAADFLLAELRTPEGKLLRSYRAGKAHINAYLEDYAYLGESLIELYEASGDSTYLEEALGLFEIVLAEFRDPESPTFFHTPEGHEHSIVRYRECADGAIPSANATTACCLARLSYHLERSDLREVAADMIKAFGGSIRQFPRAFAKSLLALDFLLDGPIELVIVGEEGSTDLKALRAEIATKFVPQRIEALAIVGKVSSELPLLRDKSPVGGKATLYICHDGTCRAPLSDRALVGDAIDKVCKSRRRDRRAT
ncbi:MAG: thioredoxin domain-containing protein [Gemmatimonadales bacterium]